MIVQNMYLPDSNYSQRSQRCLSIAAAKRPSTFDNTNLFNIEHRTQKLRQCSFVNFFAFYVLPISVATNFVKKKILKPFP